MCGRAPLWPRRTSSPSSTAHAVSTKSTSDAVCVFQPNRPIRLSLRRLTRPGISANPGCFTFAAASMSRVGDRVDQARAEQCGRVPLRPRDRERTDLVLHHMFSSSWRAAEPIVVSPPTATATNARNPNEPPPPLRVAWIGAEVVQHDAVRVRKPGWAFTSSVVSTLGRVGLPHSPYAGRPVRSSRCRFVEPDQRSQRLLQESARCSACSACGSTLAHFGVAVIISTFLPFDPAPPVPPWLWHATHELSL